MKRVIISTLLIAIAAVAMVSFSYVRAESQTESANTLPTEIVEILNSAKQSGNAYVMASVINSVKADNPELATLVDQFVEAGNTKAQEQAVVDLTISAPAPVEEAHAATEIASIAPAAGDNADFRWDGNIEFGANVKTGNTDKQQLNFVGKLNSYWEKWENTIKATVDLGEENSVNTDEEYRVKDQIRYPLSELNYSFGELEYVNDRFSGYEYRTSELVGYGHYLIKEDDLTVIGEAGLGARQASLKNGDDENSFLGRGSTKIDWKIAKNISLTEDLTISVGSDSTITESETAIKSKLSESLYLKAGFDIEHISDVPAGRDNTDTTTKITVGYDF